MKCKYCLSKNIGKAGFVGKNKNQQRYRCNKCKKFSYTKGVVEQKIQDIAMESKLLKNQVGMFESIKQRVMNIWKIIRIKNKGKS
jgi:transposase-like protein